MSAELTDSLSSATSKVRQSERAVATKSWVDKVVEMFHNFDPTALPAKAEVRTRYLAYLKSRASNSKPPIEDMAGAFAGIPFVVNDALPWPIMLQEKNGSGDVIHEVRFQLRDLALPILAVGPLPGDDQ